MLTTVPPPLFLTTVLPCLILTATLAPPTLTRPLYFELLRNNILSLSRDRRVYYLIYPSRFLILVYKNALYTLVPYPPFDPR